MSNSTGMSEHLQTKLKQIDAYSSIVLIIGCAIVIANAVLIWYFSKSKNLVWSTFLFLSNLAASDILTGVLVIGNVSAKIIYPEKLALMCRFNTGTIGVLSSTMSALCILLLSVQVSIHSFIHSFVCSFICSFIHSFIHSFINSFIHSFDLYQIFISINVK